MKQAAFFGIFITFIGHLSAETLRTLVLEVEQRLVAPTYERSVSGDPDALEDAIGKLRKLAPDKGVKEWLDLKIEREDPLKRIISEDTKYVDIPRNDRKRCEVGYEHNWSRYDDYVSRSLKLSDIVDKDNLYRQSYTFHHRLTDRWSMSAGIATPKGAIFVFEKLSVADPAAIEPKWILATLHDREITRSSPLDYALTRLTNPPIGRTAIVRMPHNTTLGAKAELDRATHTAYMNGFSKSTVAFMAWEKSSKPALKIEHPERASVDMDIIDQHGGVSQISHSGKFTVLFEKNPTHGAFETTHRDNVRDGTTTRSVPSNKKKPIYYLEAFLITPAEKR
ncbi:MAG: hypothetical protein ACSHX9_10200 [Luteolibacter sp.]